MKEQKRFDIDINNKKELKEIYKREKVLAIGASIMSFLGVCSMYASASLLNPEDACLVLGIPLEALSTYLAIGSGIHAKEQINIVRTLRKQC